MKPADSEKRNGKYIFSFIVVYTHIIHNNVTKIHKHNCCGA